MNQETNPPGHQPKTFWPTPQQERLLRAALWQGDKALRAWEAWQAQIDWEHLLTQAQERLLILPLRETFTYLHGVFAAPIPPPVLHKLHSKSASRLDSGT